MSRDITRLGGVEAASTRASRNWNIWSEAVFLAAIRGGASAEWVQAQEQRQKLGRAYAAGEAVWMAAAMLLQLWEGVQRAEREDADGRGAIRKAILR